MKKGHLINHLHWSRSQVRLLTCWCGKTSLNVDQGKFDTTQSVYSPVKTEISSIMRHTATVMRLKIPESVATNYRNDSKMNFLFHETS